MIKTGEVKGNCPVWEAETTDLAKLLKPQRKYYGVYKKGKGEETTDVVREEGLSLRLLFYVNERGLHGHTNTEPLIHSEKVTMVWRNCTLPNGNARRTLSWMKHSHKHAKLGWETIISFIGRAINSRWPSP